jgi:hypothetical protein
MGQHQRLGLSRPADRAANRDNVLDYLRNISRGEKQYLWTQIELPYRPSQLVSRRRAHPTEILGENHIGAQITEEHFVDSVESVAALHPIGDGTVDGLGRSVVKIESRPAHDR